MSAQEQVTYLTADYMETLAFRHGVDIELTADRGFMVLNGVTYVSVLGGAA